jgi:NADH-quinone oxidoreductase subunit F
VRGLDGAPGVMRAFEREIAERGLSVRLRRTGCVGMCYNEPIVDVETKALGKLTYGAVTADAVPRIIEEHIEKGAPVEEWLVRAEGRDLPDDAYYARQVRLVLRNASAASSPRSPST